MQKKVLFSVLVLLLVVVLYFWVRRPKPDLTFEVRTASPFRGSVVNTVSATGAVEPIDQVEVGTQVSGVIERLYVDFNDAVKKGQVLAELDKNALKARLLQAQASLASAENELEFQELNYKRIQELYESNLVSSSDLESAVYLYKNARAALGRLRSELEQAQVNLDYATIYSPIDGVVLDRAVEEGQTVAASFNTPTLFTIAKDLTQMQVEAAVDEADIGLVAEGQSVTFTVDAFPEEVFEGHVTQIRLSPVITSSVVTYTVIIDAPNPRLLLKPGLTATVSIVVREALDVLVLPFSALNLVIDPQLERRYSLQPLSGSLSGSPDETPTSAVWVKRGEVLVEVPVSIGLTDRVLIQIKDGLVAADSVVTGWKHTAVPREDRGSSPFLPGPPGGRR